VLLNYRLVDMIGEGAMGRVWRATDTTLDRDVAIKFLPDELATDPGRLARFEREAKLLASMNHPNIAAVYGQHEAEGRRFLVMELVPGENLADRIGRFRDRGLHLDEALDILRQIAEALETAHDCGVVHRDLKPANVMVRPDGTVKVLDFGLARAVREGPVSGNGPDAPTETASQTELGSVVGTALYMSPEQARGRPIDKRTDIWSLGCVLFESLTGKRPFEGDSTADVIAAVLSKEPDLDALPAETPESLRQLVRRCLVKNPKQRMRDAGELRLAMEELDSYPPLVPRDASMRAGTRPFPANPILAWSVAALLALALIYVLKQQQTVSVAPPGQISEWSITLPPGARVHMPGPGGKFDFSKLIAISPDGLRIAYAVQNRLGEVELVLREARAATPRPIPGTAEARAPFFSPDGQWLGFYADAALRKVALSGGSPQKVCDVGRMISFDATWSPDGRTIVYATDEGLWSVSADGGDPEPLTRPDVHRGEAGHHAPHFTADGEGIFFTVTITPEAHLAYLSLADRTWEIVVRDAAQGLPLAGDRIVFARSGELLVAAVDRRTHRLRSSGVSVLEGVHRSPGLGGMVLTQFDISATGTLVYLPQAVATTVDQLLWVDRSGNESEITRGAGTWVHPRLSPNGKRISVDIHSPDGMRDVYIFELERGQLNRLTDTGNSWESEWRPPGGERIATLSGAPPGHWSLFWVATDFSGPAELLFRSGHAVPLSWLPDGQSFFFSKHRFDGGLWRLWVDRDREPESVIASSARERFAAVSNDGRWLAYVADESGRGEVFLRSFPQLGPKTKVTIDGGGEPLFSHDGDELFFRKRGEMYRVNLTHEPELKVSPPELLFTGDYDSAAVGHQHYDISLDDQRFLMIRHSEIAGPNEVRALLHWAESLDAKLP
jgi:serine/threonine-protein kinase